MEGIVDMSSILITSTNDVSVRTFRTERYKYHSEKGWYFLMQKYHLMERMVFDMKIIKEELQFEESLKQRLEFTCEFSKVNPAFINGSIRKIENTNLSYIEPHRVIVKNTTFLVFNYSNDVYISNLSKKIKLSELEDYLKTL